MNIQLIHGQFDANDAIDIVAEMIQIKIKYHESKINSSSNEEDIKFREAKIKRLQNDLFNSRKYIEQYGVNINIQGAINLS